MRQQSLAATAWGLSVGLHLWLLTRVPGPLISEAQAKQKPVQFIILPAESKTAMKQELIREPEPQKPEPQKTLPAAPPELPHSASHPLPTPDLAAAPAAPADLAQDEPPEPSPPELTGHTLTADLGAGWSAPIGSGRARRGVFRPGVSRPTSTPGATSKKPVVAPATKAPADHVVPLARLAQKPVPPALGAALQKNYPRDARRQGQSGEAKVRARIEANGQVKLATIQTETSPGFGRACQKTLQESQWTAPLDQSGKAAATWINYRCKFRIED